MSEYDYDKAPTNPHHGGKMTPTDMVRRIEELEANLAKAVEALEAIVVDDTWGLDHDVYMICRTTLAELTGGKDE